MKKRQEASWDTSRIVGSATHTDTSTFNPQSPGCLCRVVSAVQRKICLFAQGHTHVLPSGVGGIEPCYVPHHQYRNLDRISEFGPTCNTVNIGNRADIVRTRAASRRDSNLGCRSRVLLARDLNSQALVAFVGRSAQSLAADLYSAEAA